MRDTLELLAELQALTPMRRFYQREFFRVRHWITTALTKQLRADLGVVGDETVADVAETVLHTAELVAFGTTRYPVNMINTAAYQKLGYIAEPGVQLMKPFLLAQKATEKEILRRVRMLPIWIEWASAIHGLGVLGIGLLLAETGDLLNYPTKGHLWKRMGLAVLNGVRQGGLPYGEASNQEWIEHGYSKLRRNVVWTLSESILKHPASPYNVMFQRRREQETAAAVARGLTVVAAADWQRGAANVISKMHINNRARRYMEKRLLYDMWRHWRRLERRKAFPHVLDPTPLFHKEPERAADPAGPTPAPLPDMAINGGFPTGFITPDDLYQLARRQDRDFVRPAQPIYRVASLHDRFNGQA